MYSDEIKKLETYKELIVSSFIEEGKVINYSEIQRQIDDIDLKLAIFKHWFIENGESFDAEKFNKQKYYIYRDIVILYQLIYDMAQRKLTKIQSEIKCNINYLDSIIKKHKNKVAIETTGIYGKDVYYATNGFHQYYDNGKVFIELGSVTLDSGSCIVAMVDSDEFTDEKIIFEFGENFVYNFIDDRSYMAFEGNRKINNYNFQLSENTNSKFEVKPNEDFKANQNNDYRLFKGKNKIVVSESNTGKVSYVDKRNGFAFKTETDCDIEFYVYGAERITFTCDENYIFKSFDGYEIYRPKKRQKVNIKAKAGFTLEFYTDGTVYAEMDECSVDNNKLYSKKKADTVLDFMLEEIDYGEPVTIDNVKIKINYAKQSFYDINYIMIKNSRSEDDRYDNLQY